MNPVIHFQMPYEDKKRVSAFYEKAFGWRMQEMAPEMGGYITAETSKSDPKTMRPLKTGVINGGFYKKMEDPRSHLVNVVIAVDDIEVHIEKVKKAGGTITEEPQPIPNVGLFVMFTDPEGNRV
ncbi:MAG: VOC family protein, partial [Patescibacteria group bacterium]|nr:VOC family protein [Patescibacteria group bacterium]